LFIKPSHQYTTALVFQTLFWWKAKLKRLHYLRV